MRIRLGERVELSEVNTHSPTSIGFANRDDGSCGGRLGGLDDTHVEKFGNLCIHGSLYGGSTAARCSGSKFGVLGELDCERRSLRRKRRQLKNIDKLRQESVNGSRKLRIIVLDLAGAQWRVGIFIDSGAPGGVECSLTCTKCVSWWS